MAHRIEHAVEQPQKALALGRPYVEADDVGDAHSDFSMQDRKRRSHDERNAGMRDGYNYVGGNRIELALVAV
ncbi:hypothetical protein [Mesorhizobium sp. DCY119]|uniref:hypothetical protein n=1 Tax=Mesorhizobium sp. DCY119 TaxID=2108445 RepID=UPI001A9071A5|nr:hypothetical protein [Mesorhizobium sp. DCY119]